ISHEKERDPELSQQGRAVEPAAPENQDTALSAETVSEPDITAPGAESSGQPNEQRSDMSGSVVPAEPEQQRRTRKERGLVVSEEDKATNSDSTPSALRKFEKNDVKRQGEGANQDLREENFAEKEYVENISHEKERDPELSQQGRAVEPAAPENQDTALSAETVSEPDITAENDTTILSEKGKVVEEIDEKASARAKLDEKATKNKGATSSPPTSLHFPPVASGNDNNRAARTAPGAESSGQPNEQRSDMPRSVVPAESEQQSRTRTDTKETTLDKERSLDKEREARANKEISLLKKSKHNVSQQGKATRKDLKERSLPANTTEKTPHKKRELFEQPLSPINKPGLRENRTHHTVSKGDTLWKISEQYTGSGFNYPDVAKKNKIPNPDLIYPKQQVTLPVKK
ncbi:MAG: LysM peptidoglycan-binding domain-containing protein, partial [Candidatus Electrothrix sp. ATG1]|nr:LysM peptidoglycan-binding domain-containing protein [Candidatus Electrothrix sp. ATG1]